MKIKYRKKTNKSVQTAKIVKNFFVSRASLSPFFRGFEAGVLTGLGRAFVLFFDIANFVFNGEII
jgi:hypothetical protein